MSEYGSDGPDDGAIPHEVIDVRDEIAAAIQRNFEETRSYVTAPDYRGADNVQGVAVGLGGADTGGVPGEPVVTVYLAEPAPADDARSVVVDAMQIRAASDMPIEFVTSGVIEAQQNTKKLRPAPGGFSVGNTRLRGSGTLGCLAKDTAGNVLCLSNNHVLANSNKAKIGDCITQPGRGDGGNCTNDQIGTLEKFVELKFDGTANEVDCAVGRCDATKVTPQIANTRLDDVDYFNISDQVAAPELGVRVRKSGRTTGITNGIITGIQWFGVIHYSESRVAYFTNQVVISGFEGRRFSEPGDSGSCIWRVSDERPVGLLFAGVGGVSVANPMSTVLSKLNITLYTR